MYCFNCGHQIPDDSVFCPECGARVDFALHQEEKEGHAPSTPAAGPAPGPAAPPAQPAPPAPAQPMPSGNPYLSEPAPAPKRRKSKAPIIIGIVVALLLVAGVVTAGLLTNWFGLAGSGAGAVDAGVPVRESVDEYSWEELGQISDAISAAESDEEALAIATDYNLCNDDGTLDGTQTKDIELSDGTAASVMIIGFLHDDKVDGSGRAGITFMFSDPVDEGGMNSTKTNEGGWEDSVMRERLGSDFIETLPQELQDQLVEVSKDTNNEGDSFDEKGPTYDASAISETEDTLWLPSYVELRGKIGTVQHSRDGEALAEMLNGEGSQYQLFADEGLTAEDDEETINQAPDDEGGNGIWLRTPNAASTTSFYALVDDSMTQMYRADTSFGIQPCFCI